MAAVTPPVPGRPFALLEATGSDTVLDVDPALVADLFERYGALLLRGFATDLDRFRAFAGRFCATSVFNESPDRTLLDEKHNIQSVNGGTAAFPLHPELSREPWKPDVCFFCCLSPPRTDGQTTLCDGVGIVDALPASLREELGRRRLLYRQPATAAALAFWLGTPTPTDDELAHPPESCPYSFAREAGGIVRGFTRPALHTPMFTDRPAFGNFLLFARFLLGRTDFPVFDDGRPVPEPWLREIKRVSDALTVPVGWRRGDLLMLDNSRFMHGRTAVTDVGERLIASYFGYLRCAPVNPEEPADPPWRREGFRPPVAA